VGRGEGVTWSFYNKFLAKRLARIYPSYFVGLLLCILLSKYLSHFQETSPKLIALNLSMTQSYFPSAAMRWYGAGAWSVSDEFFFYVTFPFILLAMLRIQSKHYLVLIIAALCITASIPGYIYNFAKDLVNPRFIYSFPVFRLSEFICGIAAAILVFDKRVNIKPVAALTALVIATVYLITLGTSLSWTVAHNLVILPALFIIIVSIVCNGEALIFNWLSSRLMVYLGKISYSIYIVQLPIALAFDALLERHIVERSNHMYILVWIGVNLFCAVILYHLIEHPIYLRLHMLIDGRPAKVSQSKA